MGLLHTNLGAGTATSSPTCWLRPGSSSAHHNLLWSHGLVLGDL